MTDAELQAAKDAIAMLKKEIERYEGLRAETVSWAIVYNRSDAALECRHYVLAAMDVVRALLNSGRCAAASEVIAEVYSELHIPGSNKELKPVWRAGPTAEHDEALTDPKSSVYRNDKTRELWRRNWK